MQIFRRSSPASLIVASCVALLVILLIIFGTRGAFRKNSAGAGSDISQVSGPSGTADTSSRDGAVTYKDPSDDSAPVSGGKAQEVAGEGNAKVIDLTVLSSTMVYAEVYNIMAHPDEYMGKTVKMSGPYYASYYDETGLYYHYVVVEDATSCCQQGLEFIWSGEHKYPDDYPEESTEIEVTGVFSSYYELGRTYYYMAVNEISVLR